MTGIFWIVVRRIFAFEGEGRVTQYEGGYTDYQAAFAQKYPEGVLPSGVERQKVFRCKKRERRLSVSLRESRNRSFRSKNREWDTIEETICGSGGEDCGFGRTD